MRCFGACLASALLSLALAGCGTAPSTRQGTVAGEAPDGASRLEQGQADDVTIYALGLVGTPYRYGGNTPDSGFDCSGLIAHVYQARAGVAAPRTVAMLKNWGQPVSAAQIRTGDLVLFGQSGLPTHAGIYVGGGRFVHAPSSGGDVRLDNLNSRYWAGQSVAFRRP